MSLPRCVGVQELKLFPTQRSVMHRSLQNLNDVVKISSIDIVECFDLSR